MKYFIIALLTVSGSATTAQTEEVTTLPVKAPYRYAVKLYASGMLTPHPYFFNAPMQYTISPSAAVMKRTRKGNYHEVELSRLDFRSGTAEPGAQPLYYSYIGPQYEVNRIGIAMRYEYIVQLIKRDAKFVPAVGVGAMPYFNRSAMTPYITAYYPMTTATAGIRTFVVPRLQMNFTKRLFADVNIPICLTNMGMNWQHIGNPTLPERAQNYSILDFEALPNYVSARIGLGLRL